MSRNHDLHRLRTPNAQTVELVLDRFSGRADADVIVAGLNGEPMCRGIVPGELRGRQAKDDVLCLTRGERDALEGPQTLDRLHGP